MRLINYVGKSEYCYSNSASMLLSSIGEDIRPEAIEVSAGIGLGAFIAKGTNLLFLSPLSVAPDVGLTKSLHILGYEFEERSFSQDDPPIEELRKVLRTSAVLIGPLDMSYLPYQRHASPPYLADHFVLVYGIDDKKVYLHDPYGYPNAFLTFEQLKPAWKAESIRYKLGQYHWWHSIKRVSTPSNEEVYKQTIEFFKHIYEESDKTAQKENRVINKEAITEIAGKLASNQFNEDEISMLTDFSLPLTAKRANDYANFFRKFNPDLANLKDKLSVLAGHAQVMLIEGDAKGASEKLRELASTEDQFKTTLLKVE